jgi:subtilase family serine protease
MNATSTGRGQTIAMVELGLAPRLYQTLKGYAAAMKLPAPSRTRFRELALGKVTSCAFGAEEEQLDVEASYAMAPGAHQLVASADRCANDDSALQALADADVAVINGNGRRPLASIVSNSWGNFAGEAQSVQLTSIEHAYLVQAAAEGVGMYYSTGDNSGVEPPASDPYAIAVGGTTLGIGQGGHRLFETGWSTDSYVLSGNSRSWTEQQEMGAADADPLTGMAIYELDPLLGSYRWTSTGGTSMAAPLVAGIVAAAQQGRARPFGFLDPLLYQLAGTAGLHDVLPLDFATPAAYRGVWCEPEECAASETHPGSARSTFRARP